MYLPAPPTRTEIIISIILLVVAVAYSEFIIYLNLKLKYGKTGREALKLGTNLLISSFKQTIILVSRFILLFSIMILPLLGIVIFTSLYADSLYELLSSSQSSFWIYLMLASLLADALIIFYFLGRYGALYRLPFILVIRKYNIFSSIECMFSWITLLMGFITYMFVIEGFLATVVNTPNLPILLKINLGVIIAILIAYVLPRRKPNRQFENSMNFWKKLSGCGCQSSH
jgi:hypothetical protein